MRAEVGCPTCGDEELDIEFDIDPAEPQTWMEPGWPAEVHSIVVLVDPCGCDRDEERLAEILMEVANDRAEDDYHRGRDD